MSRIGRMPIAIPSGVQVTIDGKKIEVKGPKGTLTRTIRPEITVTEEDGALHVTRPNDDAQNRAYHGLTRALLANMVTGVTTGFEKKLDLVGVGYRAAMQGKVLVLTVGYSHPVEMDPGADLEVAVPAPNKIVITGIDKEKVGEFAANVRKVRPPEPYKGKGIRYQDEVVRRKAGKAGLKK
jgi:large subunit ribosomal protein L6